MSPLNVQQEGQGRQSDHEKLQNALVGPPTCARGSGNDEKSHEENHEAANWPHGHSGPSEQREGNRNGVMQTIERSSEHEAAGKQRGTPAPVGGSGHVSANRRQIQDRGRP